MTLIESSSISAPRTAASHAILFTAFEPSGDAHAAPVIAELRRRRPTLPVYAWGGPQMRRAGAEIVEPTGEQAAMGAGSFSKIREHLAINRRIVDWIADHPVRIHIPVDSPAANFPICKLTRRAGCRVIHLVAPQLWAWGPWRVRKLRRLTDLVLCLLPFEVEYFTSRDVPVKFIGHPVMRDDDHASRRGEDAEPLPGGGPHIAILPGSRPAEVDHNLRPMVEVFNHLKASHPAANAVIAGASPALIMRMRAILNEEELDRGRSSIRIELHRLDETLAWADLALVCSGTATLDVTRSETPMVVLYRMNPIPWFLIGRWLLSSKLRALPNLIAGRRVVPEFIPHFGSLKAVKSAAHAQLDDELIRHAQLEALREIKSHFLNTNPAAIAADEILRLYDADDVHRG